jgi:outer membrane protein assembly factor BamB
MHWTVGSPAATLPRKEVWSINALDMSKRQVLKDRRAILAMRRFVTRCTAGVLALLRLGCLAALRGDREPHGNWPAYGNDAGGGRYSPLSQIDRENVGRLRVAWTYRTGEADDRSPARKKSAFEATPIMVDRTRFLSTPFNRVIALDPETGAERWVYDPRVDRERTYALVTSRGVSTWLDPDVAHHECWRDRSGQDQAARLARALGYHSAYGGGTFLAENWATGSALLLRWPIAHHEHREAGGLNGRQLADEARRLAQTSWCSSQPAAPETPSFIKGGSTRR